MIKSFMKGAFIPAFALLVLSLCPSNSNALLYHYTYVGNNFTDCYWSNPGPDRLNFDILLNSPLTAAHYGIDTLGMSGTLVSPLDRYSEDGTWFPGWYGGAWIYSLDNNGLPASWNIRMINNDGHYALASSEGGDVFGGGVKGWAQNYDDPGTWSLVILPTPTPEPSTIILFCAGLVGVVLIRRRVCN